jgi:hypothetical protein
MKRATHSPPVRDRTCQHWSLIDVAMPSACFRESEHQQTPEGSFVTEPTRGSALEPRFSEQSVSRLSADRGLLAAEQANRSGGEYVFGAVVSAGESA